VERPTGPEQQKRKITFSHKESSFLMAKGQFSKRKTFEKKPPAISQKKEKRSNAILEMGI
jgi:tRNA 2-selenouridine synthase SelU